MRSLELAPAGSNISFSRARDELGKLGARSIQNRRWARSLQQAAGLILVIDNIRAFYSRDARGSQPILTIKSVRDPID